VVVSAKAYGHTGGYGKRTKPLHLSSGHLAISPPYLYWRAAPERIAEAGGYRRKAEVLAVTYERRAENLAAAANVRRMHARRDAAGLVAALRHPDPNMRRQAIRYLADPHSPAAVEPLMEIVRNRDHPDRESAIVALGDIGDRRPVDMFIALVPLLERGAAGSLAAEALGKIGDRRAVPPLRKVLARLSNEIPGDATGQSMQALYRTRIEDAIAAIGRRDA
jgi:HEAT repeat protein